MMMFILMPVHDIRKTIQKNDFGVKKSFVYKKAHFCTSR